MDETGQSSTDYTGAGHWAGKYWFWLGTDWISERMETFMKEIKSCLQVITNPKDAKPGEFKQTLARLDEIVREQKLDLHPRLRHFLENRSYQKAVTWLRGETPEKGSCGG